MNLLQLPTEFDLPSDHADARRSLLVAEIDDATPVRPIRRRPATLIAAAAAVAIGIVAVPLARGGDDSRVLAYALAAGDALTYEFAYDSSTAQTPLRELPEGLTLGGTITVSAHGQIAYRIEPGLEPGTLTVEAAGSGAQLVAENGEPFENETTDSVIWPVARVAVDTDGRIVEWLGEHDVEIPGFLVQSPVPGQTDQTILPYAFGPTFPDEPVAAGDSWSTSEPPFDCDAGVAGGASGPCDPALFSIGEHRVVREEELRGRSTVVIESSYTEPTRPDEDVRSSNNDATVWFDPARGIIVKVEWAASMESDRTSTYLGLDPAVTTRDLSHATFSAELVED